MLDQGCLALHRDCIGFDKWTARTQLPTGSWSFVGWPVRAGRGDRWCGAGCVECSGVQSRISIWLLHLWFSHLIIRPHISYLNPVPFLLFFLIINLFIHFSRHILHIIYTFISRFIIARQPVIAHTFYASYFLSPLLHCTLLHYLHYILCHYGVSITF